MRRRRLCFPSSDARSHTHTSPLQKHLPAIGFHRRVRSQMAKRVRVRSPNHRSAPTIETQSCLEPLRSTPHIVFSNVILRRKSSRVVIGRIKTRDASSFTVDSLRRGVRRALSKNIMPRKKLSTRMALQFLNPLQIRPALLERERIVAALDDAE